MGNRERNLDRMRQDLSRWRALAATLALLGLAAAGCGRNAGNAPTDFSPSGINGGQDLLTVEMTQEGPDSALKPAVRVRIYDRSPANGFGLYRRLPGQGFDEIQQVPARFDGTFNDRVETYEAIDHDWQPNRQVDYMARGTFNGTQTGVSPLTNQATLPAAATAESLLVGNIVITCPVSTSTFTAKVDSTPVLVWDPVPGAVRYLLQVQRLDKHLFFYGFTPPDGSSSYKLGSGLGDVMHENTLTLTSFFYWTVEAIDGNSRVIGRSVQQSFQARTITQPDSLVFCTP
jgi:hypothetical protein